ncbi:hypothetical protein NQ315_006821 [Exocentrus adspersus]|uniref:Uncharacterized protein n=1 Tax=Exocentrus adspersus TaxID=1586481 RepID=A0AAV8WC17_9CUCU|nr:hypothetical protein NQ315_006821 [Exocentrus adspersus]
MTEPQAMDDPSVVVLIVLSLLMFVICLLTFTKMCKCACVNTATQEEPQRRTSNDTRASIYIIEENGDVLVINPSAGDVEKCEVKHSYENLAPPPYFSTLDALAHASYELPPSYPIDT